MKPIKFKKESYDKHLERYNKKEEVKAQLKTELLNIVGDKYEVEDDKLFKDPIGYLYECIEHRYKKQNVMLLSGFKLAELMQIDIDAFRVLAYKFNNDHKAPINEPNVEDYTVYAETEDEIKRLEYCESLIQLYEEFEDEYGGRVIPRQAIISLTPQVIFFNYTNNTFEPNIHFIKPEIVRRGF